MGWDRCSTITVSINDANAPAGWRGDFSNAVRQLTEATGLNLKVTNAAAEVTIAWSSTLMAPGQTDADKAGVTRASIHSTALGSTISSARIQISTHLTSGGGHQGELPVLLHEFGHAVGLGHFEGPEVMNPVDQGYPMYQSGDIAGLSSLYQPESCS